MRGGYRGAYKKSQIREKFLLDPSLRNLKKTQMGGQTSSEKAFEPTHLTGPKKSQIRSELGLDSLIKSQI